LLAVGLTRAWKMILNRVLLGWERDGVLGWGRDEMAVLGTG
jgi:hypothetical protein